MMNILVEDPMGNVELIYAGSQSPQNLVKEIRYYPNGDTLSVTPMKKGAVDGVVTFYYPENKPKEQTAFVKGMSQGEFKRFDKSGVLVLEGALKNGEKNGVWTTWYDEVQKQEERTYSDNQPDGKWTYWYIDGELKREEVYKLGKLIEEKDFN
jgi:antitoxin component YwqK of YwqJK toxin-antitoxin module